MKLLISLFLLVSQFGLSQSKDPREIINNVITNFNKVEDYQADVNIKVDIEFIKVPETKIKIYFKQPDKIHFESDGFAMLPKNGMEFSTTALLKKDFTAIYEQDVDLNGVKTSVVKVIPLGDQGEVILSTYWIDQKKRVIRKVESTTKTNGTFVIDFSYDDKLKYPLPSKMVFSFNMDKMHIPPTLSGETNNEKSDKKNKNSDSRTRGKVIVSYSNYLVNKDIPDSIFKDNDKNAK